MSRGGRGGVRLIGGRLGGRTLAVPQGARPTEGRVREALFSIWAERLPDASFLDLFAGSGAVGLEAAGRGARHAVLVEASRPALRVLRAGLERLGLPEVTLVAGEVPRCLADRRLAAEAPYDLVFADPPYRFRAYEALLREVAPLLAAAGELAIEHAGEIELPQEVTHAGGALVRCEVRRYGGTRLSFYRSLER